MSSHPYYPNLDPEAEKIATFSRRIIHDYLRQELNFRGVIASDDLEMGAIKAICPIGEAGVLATAAGHDLLLVCHDLTAQKEVYYRLLQAYKSGQLPREELEESVERIERLKLKRDRRFAAGEPAPEPAGGALAAEICRAGVRVLQDQKNLLPLKPSQKILVMFPQFSALDAKIMIEREVLPEKQFISREFQKFGVSPQVRIVGLEPADAEIKEAAAMAGASDVTVLFCYDAHLYPSNKKLLDEVQGAAGELVVTLLRDPYDAAWLREKTAGLTAYGWRACQIRAAIEKICTSCRI